MADFPYIPDAPAAVVPYLKGFREKLDGLRQRLAEASTDADRADCVREIQALDHIREMFVAEALRHTTH